MSTPPQMSAPDDGAGEREVVFVRKWIYSEASEGAQRTMLAELRAHTRAAVERETAVKDAEIARAEMKGGVDEANVWANMILAVIDTRAALGDSVPELPCHRDDFSADDAASYVGSLIASLDAARQADAATGKTEGGK